MEFLVDVYEANSEFKAFSCDGASVGINTRFRVHFKKNKEI